MHIGIECQGGDNRTSEQIITDLMKDDLGVTIDPQAFRLWLRWRWDRVSTLTHRIHEGKR